MEIDMLRSLFIYDPSSGSLHWKSRPENHFSSAASATRWNANFSGKEVGALDKKGYRATKIGGKHLLCHRIIWAITHGEWPDQIDHINNIRDDNRLDNLRSVSNAQNQKNRPLQKNNTSGVSGVHRHFSTRLWESGIGVNGRYIVLGAFRNFHDAVAVRRCAEIVHRYHPNHGRNHAA